METKILPPNPTSLTLAAHIIQSGGLVAFPTETVYGLGADATDGDAVRSIFTAKGRPSDNPLIVHLADPEQIAAYVCEMNACAKKLAEAFMPGPITLVMKKRPCIAEQVSAGLDSVGIRIPCHPAARAFLAACDRPIAAPSANTSTRPSPTTAGHVYEDLAGKIPLILDGGACQVGIESTVVNVMGEVPVLLRPGFVTAEEIERVCGAIAYADPNDARVRSPGVKYRHYAPSCQVILLLPSALSRIPELLREYADRRITLICTQTTAGKNCSCRTLVMGSTPADMAQHLFDLLREAEKFSDLILLEAPPEGGMGSSVLNRMRKACGGNILE